MKLEETTVHDAIFYIENLAKIYSTHQNPENALAMKKYMRNQFEFFGIKTPQRNILDKQFLSTEGLPHYEDLSIILKILWQKPEREFQYFGMVLMEKFIKKIQEEDVLLLEWLITHKSWWDTVDLIASHLVGGYFKKYPQNISTQTQQWMKSENIWLQRTCILFQLQYKDKIDVDLLFDLIEELKEKKEFFIQKAIGWALRQLSKTKPALVQNFVENSALAKLSTKEALKHINKGKINDC